MKQIVFNVEESKYRFFMELIKNFDVITVSSTDIAKKQLLKEVSEGMQAAMFADKGKLKTRSAKVFLNEL